MTNDNSPVGLLKVPVTTEHVDRALRAMAGECADSSRDMSIDDVMMAAAVIANLEEFDGRTGFPFLAMALVHEVLPDYVSYWACGKFGLEKLKGKRARRSTKAMA